MFWVSQYLLKRWFTLVPARKWSFVVRKMLETLQLLPIRMESKWISWRFDGYTVIHLYTVYVLPSFHRNWIWRKWRLPRGISYLYSFVFSLQDLGSILLMTEILYQFIYPIIYRVSAPSQVVIARFQPSCRIWQGGGFNYFLIFFHPDPWGLLIQFDSWHFFRFKWVGNNRQLT